MPERFQLVEEARLLTGTVDEVLRALSEHAAEARRERYRWGNREQLELSLLSRKDRRIDLALAEHATSARVVAELFRRTASSNGSTVDSYLRGLRIACLSNDVGGLGSLWSVERDELTEWLKGPAATDFLLRADDSDLSALLSNPTLSAERLADLYEGAGIFASLSIERRLRLIQCTVPNRRLDSDLSSVSGPDLEYCRLERAIGSLIATAPVEPVWLSALSAMIEARDPFVFSPRLPAQAAIERWRPLRTGDEKDDTGFWTGLPKAQEFCVLVASLCFIEDGQSFADADSEDVLRRCAFYGRATLKAERLMEFFARDKAVFVYAALQNPGIFGDAARQRLEKEFLLSSNSGSNMWPRYKTRCQQMARKYPWFDPRPATDFGKEVLCKDTALSPEEFDQARRERSVEQLHHRLAALDRGQRYLWALMVIGFVVLAVAIFART